MSDHEKGCTFWQCSHGCDCGLPERDMIAHLQEVNAELLEELIKARKVIGELSLNGNWWIDSPNCGGFDTDTMDTAIAKARGEQ